jgi:hypothetical protein
VYIIYIVIFACNLNKIYIMISIMQTLKEKLNQRSTKELKQDIRVAKSSDSLGSIRVFVSGLNVLEERLSKSEYELFEDSL